MVNINLLIKPPVKIFNKKGDFGYIYYIVIQGQLDLLMPNIQKEENNEQNQNQKQL